MNKTKRFNAAYDYLMSIGRIHKQKDVAAAISSTESNISQALKGNPKVLTGNLLMRFLIAFPDIFSTRWLMTGEGQMLLYGTSPSMTVISDPITLATIHTQLTALAAQFTALAAHLGAPVSNINKEQTYPSVSPSEQEQQTEHQ